VNLSAQTACDPALLDDLARVLELTKAPPELLVLEVTERTAIADMESSAGILEGARDMGVRIALDDFGKGYSSLATLDQLPIGYLKIDKEFVRGIGRRSKDEYLIRAIAGFSRGVGIPIVAEGIETEEQLRWLRNEGIRLGQGYLLAAPASADAVLAAADPAGTVSAVDAATI
jgi:EAL domain-containing protein (putative c-di-GMP-specific phosphodiesterase class I)